MYNYSEGTIKGYLEDLAAKKMTPGGGSASSMAAALGAGLNLMVMNYSEILSPEKEEQEKILNKLSVLIDQDCTVFQELMKALSEKRDAQVEYVSAAEVPFEICKEAYASLVITEKISHKAKKSFFTDVGGAAYLLKAAFMSAELNVEINLKYITDGSFVEGTRKELSAMKEKMEKLASGIELRLSGVISQ